MSEHRQAAIGGPWPFFPRSVPIEFDAVAVWVLQAKSLAHAVIGRAFERNVSAPQAEQRIRQRSAIRIEDGNMV
jgi:hypothetical protein